MRRLLIAVMSGCGLLGGCTTDRQPIEAVPVERAERYEEVMHAPEVPITELLENPQSYNGQSVRVRGKVSDLMNPRAIVLEENGLFGTRSVLVLTREPANPMGWMLQPGQQAIAVGIVRTGDTGSIERELARPLAPEIRRVLGSGPVVIARSVGRVHGDNIDWTEPAGVRPGTAR